MKCDQASTWLLMSDSPAEPPPRVARHLELCEDCRERQQRLVRLERDVAEAALPPGSAAAKERFLREFARQPAPPVIANRELRGTIRRRPKRPAGKHRRTIACLSGVAATLVVLLVGGWVLQLRQPGEPPGDRVAQHPGAESPDANHAVPRAARNDSTPPPPFPSPAQPVVWPALLDPLIDNHLRLAAADTAAERFTLVADLSEVLWQEIARQATSRPTELAPLSQWYGHVVGDSLPNLSRTLTPADQPLRERIARELANRRTTAQRLADQSVPAVAEVLQRIGDHSNAAAEWIVHGALPPDTDTNDWELLPASDLVGTVLASNLQLAYSDDPLQRARESSDVADQLSRTIMFTSHHRDAGTSERLGAYLGEVVEQAVMISLARVELAGEDDPRLAEFEHVKQRGQRAIKALERNLEGAPEPARQGLLRALEAQQRGQGIAREKGKALPHEKAGKPRGKAGDFVPPGLRNRMLPDR